MSIIIIIIIFIIIIRIIINQRRADIRLTTIFKVMGGLISVDTKELLRPVQRTTRRRHTHPESFIPLQTFTSSERLYFFPRTITQWHNLPPSIFTKHCSLDSFKYHISLNKKFKYSQTCSLVKLSFISLTVYLFY